MRQVSQGLREIIPQGLEDAQAFLRCQQYEQFEVRCGRHGQHQSDFAREFRAICQVALEFEEGHLEFKLATVLKKIEEPRPFLPSTRGVGPPDCQDLLRVKLNIEASQKIIRRSLQLRRSSCRVKVRGKITNQRNKVVQILS